MNKVEKADLILFACTIYMQSVIIFFMRMTFITKIVLNDTGIICDYFIYIHKLSVTEHCVFYICNKLNYIPKNNRIITNYKLLRQEI